METCLSQLLRGNTPGHLCPDNENVSMKPFLWRDIWPYGGRGDVHPNTAKGRGEEDKLCLGEGPHDPRGHWGEAGQHDDDVVIHIVVMENWDKDESSQVTNKILRCNINTAKIQRLKHGNIFWDTL